jgi:hypothetical protein
MPRRMPPYTAAFQRQLDSLLKLAEAGELAAQSSVRSDWYATRVESLYELAFLRIFIEWELLLEQSFLRYLCGYVSSHGTFSATAGAHCRSLAVAEGLIFGPNGFATWHNPARVVSRAHGYLILCPHETVIQASRTRVEQFSWVRHRIAHGQGDAKRKFDQATMALTGRRYPGARPGRFLRDWDRRLVPAKRWIEVIGAELVGLAGQIV